jgi:hypothetical protein
MIHDLTKYFLEPTLLDTLSVKDIENEIDGAPFASSGRMLLAKKMSDFENQQIMLVNNDRVWMHYLQYADHHIPSVYDISTLGTDQNGDLDQGNQSVVVNENVENVEKLSQNAELQLEDKTVDEMMMQGSEKTSDITSGVTSDIIISENIEEAPKPASKVSTKNKKKKIKKFKLNEYRGISEFSKWLLSFKKEDIEKQIKKEEKTARKKALGESAKKSVTKSATIISESLAEILASQGHLDDAKKMYEQLKVKYPEKSSYFAAKIETLIKI